MDKSLRISVVMPSYLETYVSGPHKSADNREFKFIRAVDSYLRQIYKNAELIIVSDGCDKTAKIYQEVYSSDPSIRFVKLPKQHNFSGAVRQAGVDIATGDLICYLDSDDMFGPNHLDTIAKSATGCSWYYYDDYLFDGVNRTTRPVHPEHCYIGTSSFCHMRNVGLRWQDGYGHDWRTIETILGLPNKKIPTPEYLVCHVSGLNIDY